MTETYRYANGDSVEYWEGAEQDRLLFQKCSNCGSVQFPPRHHCATCWEAELEWIESSGLGEIESFTIVRRAPLPQYRGKVPYVVAAVKVEEGPRMLTNIVGDRALDLKMGDKAKVTFVTEEGGERLPQFELV